VRFRRCLPPPVLRLCSSDDDSVPTTPALSAACIAPNKESVPPVPFVLFFCYSLCFLCARRGGGEWEEIKGASPRGTVHGSGVSTTSEGLGGPDRGLPRTAVAFDVSKLYFPGFV
jgi:hypothetical protein